MSHWYSIRNISPTLAEISIYEEIGYFGITAKAFLEELRTVGDRRIHLRINSPGGEVFDGLAIYNRLLSHTAGVEVSIDGIAASMASVLAMAGAPIRMADNAFLMIHNPTGYAGGESKDLRETADLLDKLKQSLVNTYVRKTGLPVSTIEQMMDAETWLSAEEAKAQGFIDEITAPVQARASFDTRRFRNAPSKLTHSRMKSLILSALGLANLTEASPDADFVAAVEQIKATATKADSLTAEVAQLKEQFHAATELVTQAKGEAEKLSKDVASLTTERDTLRAAFDHAKANTERLETLLKLKGTSAKNAVPPVDNPEDEVGNTMAAWEQRITSAATLAQRAKILEQLRAAITAGTVR